jgi:hypothetical protein
MTTVAAALLFDINTALRRLLEIQIDFASKTTVPLCITKREVLSKIIAHYGVIESQSHEYLLYMYIFYCGVPFLRFSF